MYFDRLINKTTSPYDKNPRRPKFPPKHFTDTKTDGNTEILPLVLKIIVDEIKLEAV